MYKDKAAELVEQLNKPSDLYNLPEGWNLSPEERAYSDHLSGTISGPDGKKYLRYNGKTASYDSYLDVSMLDEPEETTNQEDLEKEALQYLKKTMSTEIYDRYHVQLDSLLHGDMCARGYGSSLRAQVSPTMEWYMQNKTSMQIFLDGEYKETTEGKHFQQFLEMFSNQSNYRMVEEICTNSDAGVAAAMTGGLRNGGIYETWKNVREGRQSMPKKRDDECCIM